MVNSALFSSNSDEWATPAEFFEALNNEFRFNLDVCASSENHKTERYFDQNDDGLSKNWGGAVSFAILHIQKSVNGLKKHITNLLNLTH